MDQIDIILDKVQEEPKFNIPKESMLWDYIAKAAKGGPTAKIIFIAITSQVEGKIKSEGLPYGQGKSIFSAILAGQIFEIFDSFLGLEPYKSVQKNMGYTWEQHTQAVEESNERRKVAYIMDDLQRIAGKSKSRDPYVQAWAEFFTTARPFFGVVIFTCPNIGDLAKCFRELINFEIKIPREGEYEVQFLKAISNFRKPLEPMKLMRYKGEGIIPRAPKWFVDWYTAWRKESSFGTFIDRIKNYKPHRKPETTPSIDTQYKNEKEGGTFTGTRAEYREKHRIAMGTPP
jgi:hypothetical protein